MKKGFTLIELLAVIVILAIIALIATPIVLSIINDSKNSATIRSAEFYVDAVKNEVALKNMKDGGTFNPGTCTVERGNLKCGEDILDIKVDGERPTGGSIIFENGKVTNVILNYPNGTVTLNNKGEFVLGELEIEDSICSLVDGEPNTIGSKYQCKVKDDMEEGFEEGYFFYVLSHNNDGTTNLIMDRNMYYDGTVLTTSHFASVAWYGEEDVEDNSKGPVSAMNYLHSATKDWHNVPDMIMDYEDENIDTYTREKGTTGYGGIKTSGNVTIITDKLGEETGRIENLNYPQCYKELYEDENGDLTPGEIVECSEAGYIEGVYDEKISHIEEIHGYWTLSSHSNGESTAWFIYESGAVGTDNVFFGDYGGVRPVITLQI